MVPRGRIGGMHDLDIDGDLGVVAFVVPDRELSPLAVRQAASERLPETMLPDRFVLVADLPLTSSSKVDERRLLKEAGLSSPRREPQPLGDRIDQKLIKRPFRLPIVCNNAHLVLSVKCRPL